ncbi:MAG: hypothetical protein M3O28_00330 [Actinomycetota bacterium]|nr:hypothetical protein [Actinomycetota bacterium]
MPNFETFRRALLPLKSEPFVTIQKRGTMSLNLSAFVALDSPVSVELLYDRGKEIVGIRVADPRADNAYHVRTTSPSGPFVVSAMAFTKFYDLDIAVTRRWPAYLDNGVLCVDLTKDGLPVTSNRARRRRDDEDAS